MEFGLDNENIQIKIKDEKGLRENSNCSTDGSLFYKINALETEGKENKWVLSQIENQTSFMSSIVLCEVMLRLDDFYLINNIKLFISEENDTEITINKIKFQNVNTRLWEWSFFFNPDNKEIISRTSDSISIFGVGLTDYIKFQFFMKFDEEFEGDTTTNSNNELLALRKVKNILNKIVVYSQYIYSIPNATFLMTLLNLTTFFKNYVSLHQLEQNAQDNYICSLYLTASSMIQARLFIQALELLKILQLFIINDISTKNYNFFAILFEINEKHMLKSNSIEDNKAKKGGNGIEAHKHIFLTKIELIKAVSMFEHGHMHVFLNFLKNCIQMYQKNDFSCIQSMILLTKVNEICSDKLYIQNFLLTYGNSLIDILIAFLKDKNELLTHSVLKVIEFIVDYTPQIIFPSLSKIIKHLFKLSYYYTPPKPETQSNPMIDSISLYKSMKEDKIFFPVYLLINWVMTNDSSQKQKNNNNAYGNNTSGKYINNKNALSQVLQKQINYTLDTIITNFDNFSYNVVFQVTQKTHLLLFDIIHHSDKDSLLYLNAIKLLRKCFENEQVSIFQLNSIIESTEQNILTIEFLYNLFILGIKPTVKGLFRDYLQIQTATTSINKTKSSKNSKESKDMIQTATTKSYIIATLLNTHSIIEGNDSGNLLMMMLEKVSDHCINCFDKDSCSDLLKWINRNLSIVINELQDNDHSIDFTLYYAYLLLQFSFIIIFPTPKNVIKKTMYSIPIQKHILFNSKFMDELEVFIDQLFKIEQFTLINKPSFILFEIVMEILKSIDMSYGSAISFPFEMYFQQQYISLNKFIHRNGLFNDNVAFLLKTLPLCPLEDIELVNSLKDIYRVILINFTNYYSEESFLLFTLILSKLDEAKLIDNSLFKDITKAIISKANYKGNSVKQCYNKYFDIIYCNLLSKESNSYYNWTESFMIDMFTQYKEMMNKHNDKILFKDFYLEIIEMIDLIKNYYDYTKGIVNKNNVVNKDLIERMMIFNNNQLKETLESIMLGKYYDETIVSKINSLIEANLSLFDINEYNNEYYFLYLNQIDNSLNYHRAINKTTNGSLLNENCKYLTNMIFRLNKFDHILTLPQMHKRLKLLIDLFGTINLDSLKTIQLKNLTEELMSFFECFILPINEFDFSWNNNTNTTSDSPHYSIDDSFKAILKDYYSLLLKIFSYHLESLDEVNNLFGIEILLKLFNVKMNETIDVPLFKSKLLSNKSSLLWLNSITEKIIKLILHSNYKISLFAIYTIQLLTIDRDSLEPILQLKLFTNNNTRKSSRLKLKEVSPSFYWMDDNEITVLHNLLREKIMMEYKQKLFEKGDDNEQQIEDYDDDALNLDKGIKVDEMEDEMDDDFNDDAEEESNDSDHQIIIQRPNEAGSIINQSSNSSMKNMAKDDEDNLTLEELGVVEVDDEIFDNFDEENIPILKSNCVRSKGFAAKLKTNQNSRTLLMSEHVQQYNQAQKHSRPDRYHNSIEDNDDHQDNTNEEFGDVPDLTTKKKNIRPLNGLRPATPPLKNNNPTTNVANNSCKALSSNLNIPPSQIHHNASLNTKTLKSVNNIEFFEEEEEVNQLLQEKELELAKEREKIIQRQRELDKEKESQNKKKEKEDNERYLRNNQSKNMNRCRSEDKYEIQSMEELFLDEENHDNENTFNHINHNNEASYKESSYSSAIISQGKYQSKFQKPSLNMNLIGAKSTSSVNMNKNPNNKKEIPPKKQGKEGNQLNKIEGQICNDNQAIITIEDEVIMNNQCLNFCQPPKNIKVNKQQEICLSDSFEAEKYLEDELDDILYEEQQGTKAKSNRPPIKSDIKERLEFNISDLSNNTNQNVIVEYNPSNTLMPNSNTNQLSLLDNSKPEGMNKTFTFSCNPHNSPEGLENSRNLSLNNIKQDNNTQQSRKAIKNIHNLHNMQKKSSSSQGDLNLLQTMADIKKNNFLSSTKEDFRTAVRKKINQDPNKIINNLKKLSKITQGPQSERKTTIKEDEISEKSFNSKKKPLTTLTGSNNINNVIEGKSSGPNTPNFNHQNKP